MSLAIIAFAPGLALGSFLNGVATQLPARNVPLRARAACSQCGHPMSITESVALFSYLLRGGSCSHCGARRGLRYPFLELATAFLFVACFTHFGLSGRAFVACGFCAVLLVLAVIDIEQRILPNAIVLPAAAVILLADIVIAPSRTPEWTIAAFATALGAFALALVYRGALGMGDVKLAFLLGAALGRHVVLAVIVGMLAASVAAALVIMTRGLKARKEAIPFGPFLALGAFVALFAG
jgi:leader peptidase (prepilin peptidase) / N-methyltransferase